MVRVYILSNNDLFGQGVMSLLSRETELEIVGQGAQVTQAIEDIHRLKPDTVIVESNDLIQDSVSIVAMVLNTEAPLQVIGLDLKENHLHLYHGEQREARDVEDLMSAIKNEVSVSHPIT